MSLKVAKFGGSSLADAGMIDRAACIVRSDPDRRYIVPSAPGKRHADDRKITDLLYLCHAAAAQKVGFEETFGLIRDRYLQIVKLLELKLELESVLDDIHRQIADGASSAFTASRGEYLNGLILADLLGFAFVDPAGMIIFDEHGRFQPEQTNVAVARALGEHPRAVIPGFYGSGPDGAIHTFSRGGSDITGAIVARATEADVYENWTDVPGLLMADPRIIDQPHPIDKITYRELRELAYMGANVLHDEAIFPVRKAGIPVNIRNTHNPDQPGSVIVPDDYPIAHTGTITGVAGRKNFTILTIEKALMNSTLGFGRRLLNVLEVHGISFEHLPSGIDTMSVVISDDQLNDKLQSVLDDIENELHPDSVEVSPEMALIATVGRGMSHTPGMAARLFNALAEASINVGMIDQGSSELNIIVGVEADVFETAVKAIYHAFVE